MNASQALSLGSGPRHLSIYLFIHLFSFVDKLEDAWVGLQLVMFLCLMEAFSLPLYFSFVCIGVLITCVSVADPLEQELQTVESCHGCAGNRTLVLWKSRPCS